MSISMHYLICIILATTTAYASDELEGFERVFKINSSKIVPGSNWFFISAKGDHLSTIDRFGIVNRIANGSIQLLTNGIPAGAKAVSVGASPDGWHHACTDDGLTYRWDPTANRWIHTGGAKCIHVSAMNKNTAVSVTWGDTGSVWKYSSGVWTQLPNQSKEGGQGIAGGKYASIGEDGTIWMINHKGRVFSFNSTSNNWDPIPVLNAVSVDVRNASYGHIITSACNVYNYNSGKWSNWNQNFCPVQIASNNKRDYFLTEHQNFEYV